MVQHSKITGGQPSEQAPLLGKDVNANGHGGVSVSAVEVPVEEPPVGNGNGVNGAILKTGTGDEESQGKGEVEEAVNRNHVAQIILVLLIGRSC